MQVFFHFCLLFFPMRTRARSLPAPWVPGQIWGACGDAGGDLYAAKQLSGLQLFKKCPLSAKVFKLPKHFGNYSISFCCQLGNLFHSINCQKTKTHFFGGRIFLSHYCWSAVMDLVRHWACLVCGVSLRTPHEGLISKGNTDTLLHFCLGRTPTLIPTIGLWFVSPIHSLHFSRISVLPD